MILTAVAACAQPPGRSKFEAFEVATIKPASSIDERAGRYIRMQSAHRFQAKNYTINGLIAAAYDINPKALSGSPSWAGTDHFEVIAATPGADRPTYDDQMRMLRKLLADRLNLQFHREKKEFSVYELTVAKDGPKFKLSDAAPDESPNVTSTVYPGDGGIDYVHLPGRNATMAQFASVLQRAILDRPVVDSTGLSGRFDFDLEWTPDEGQFGGTLSPAPTNSGKPAFFPAIQQQLGLRLEAMRAQIDTLVVDRLDRPSEN